MSVTLSRARPSVATALPSVAESDISVAVSLAAGYLAAGYFAAAPPKRAPLVIFFSTSGNR